MAIPLRKLGTQGLQVSALGLGCMGLSYAYGASVPEEEGISLIRHAYERGITFFDTADMYGPFTNEILIGKALKHLPREKVQLATKFGNVFENGKYLVKGSPEYVRHACEDSLARLDVEYIDLYYQHNVDQTVPIEKTMGELKKLVEEGKVKYIGLSNASIDTIRRAHAVHPVSAVQLEWSLWARDIEEDAIPICRELGIGIVPYSPLGKGFFSGKAAVEKITDEQDIRKSLYPRYSGENLEKNRIFYERVADIARKHGCTAGQLALAWVLNQGDDVVPIPGTTNVKNFEENLGSINVKLTREALEEITAAVPENEVAGLNRPEQFSGRHWKVANTPPLEA